jgi:hypothetical protein
VQQDGTHKGQDEHDERNGQEGVERFQPEEIGAELPLIRDEVRPRNPNQEKDQEVIRRKNKWGGER